MMRSRRQKQPKRRRSTSGTWRLALFVGGLALTTAGCPVDPTVVPEVVEEVTALQDGQWSKDIWGLEGLLRFPEGFDTSVTIDGVEVELDISVRIQEVLVRNGGVLKVSTSNRGNLRVGPRGIRTSGRIRAGNGRSIRVPDGQVVIEPNGAYEADPLAVANASLSAAQITIIGGFLEPDPETSIEPLAGRMELTGVMSVSTTGKLVLDGLGITPERQQFGPFDPGTDSCTPPVLGVGNNTTVSVGGDLILIHECQVDVEAGGTVEVGGDFQNELQTSEDFDWNGLLVFTDSGTVLHFFEVADEDPLEEPNMQIIVQQVRFEDGFAMGQLEVEPGSQAILRDAFDNDDAGQDDCTEALFVKELNLGAGSTLTIQNANVYYIGGDISAGTVDEGADCGRLFQCTLENERYTCVSGS